MEIIVAPSAGFCFGVKRAVNMALEAAEKAGNSGKQLSTLGPIIHNPQVVKSLEEKGVYPVGSVEECACETILIRSHGVKSDIMARMKLSSIKIIDATCPFVKKAQNYVSDASSSGHFVVMVGDRNHPEVQSVMSFADPRRSLTINGIAEIGEIPFSDKIALISQTTQDVNFYNSIINEVKRLAAGEVVVFETICDATMIKQEEARVIASKVDVMIVVGGYNSANTNKLQNICSKIQENTYHIETEDEVKPEWFNSARKVGITAGASTPDWIIERVFNRIKLIGSKN